MARDPLLQLCRDRPLVTPELHASNDFYGHATLLKRYAGLPATRSLSVAIEHAITFNEYLWEVDLGTQMAGFLCGSPETARTYEARTGHLVPATPIGPLALYARRSPVTQGPRTLAVFPTHSSHRVRTEFDIDAFVGMIDEVRGEFERVLVCVYWKDVLHGLHRTFEARGLACVSAGHMFDPEFLPRLLAILDGATMVFTNEVGTHMLIATLLDKPVWLRRMEIRYVAAQEILDVDVPQFVDHPTVTRALDLFAKPRDDVSPEQRTFVEELTGAACHRTPEAMREILLEADARYRRTRPLDTYVKDLALTGLHRARRLRDRLRRR